VKNGVTDVMMDVSDGLILDLSRMMDESRKQARIHWEKVPMPRQARQRGLEELAFGGGEDYQLLFAFPRKKLPVLAAMIKKGRAVTIIGEVAAGRGVRVYRHGSEIASPKEGYDHFGGKL